MRRMLLFPLLFFILSGCSETPVDPRPRVLVWSSVASLPDLPGHAHHEGEDLDQTLYVSSSLGDRLFVLDHDGGLHAFDTRTRRWSRHPRMPTARHHAMMATLEGRIYVLGGELEDDTILADVESFDPATGTWATHEPLPLPVCMAGTLVLDERIYVIGGDGPWGPSNATQIFDPATGAWSSGAEMPSLRCVLGLGSADGWILAVGGIDADWQRLDRVEAYHPVQDRWERRASLPKALSHHATVTLGGRVLALGGRDKHGLDPDAATNEVFIYDAETDSWETTTPTRRDRFYAGVATVGSEAWILGGWNDDKDRERAIERGRFEPIR